MVAMNCVLAGPPIPPLQAVEKLHPYFEVMASPAASATFCTVTVMSPSGNAALGVRVTVPEPAS